MNALEEQYVFISASFPSGVRAKEVEPFDADAIADAVTAVVRAVLLSEGRLIFGGHPTITPLVLMIGNELGSFQSVDIFQSEWFRNDITAGTLRLVESGVGEIHWTPRRESLDASLTVFRDEMLAFRQLACGIFIGGMSGIWREYERFGTAHPLVPRIPITGPGGAAAQIPIDQDALPRHLVDQLNSLHYPFLAAQIVDWVGQRPSSGSV